MDQRRIHILGRPDTTLGLRDQEEYTRSRNVVVETPGMAISLETPGPLPRVLPRRPRCFPCPRAAPAGTVRLGWHLGGSLEPPTRKRRFPSLSLHPELLSFIGGCGCRLTRLRSISTTVSPLVESVNKEEDAEIE